MSTILDHIRDYGQYIRDPRMDGFTQFGAKQNLYRILWETQRQLENSPDFVGEKEWVENNICATQHK